MNNIPFGFQSPALAQARLLGHDNSSNLENVTKYDKIQANNPCKKTMSNISTIPRFNSSRTGALRTDFGLPIEQLIELLARTAKTAYEKILISERGQGIIAKALKYNISFDDQNINWLSLIDEINEYEGLITRSNELNIDWDYRVYDPIGLEQEIEAYEYEERWAISEARACYYASR